MGAHSALRTQRSTSKSREDLFSERRERARAKYGMTSTGKSGKMKEGRRTEAGQGRGCNYPILS